MTPVLSGIVALHLSTALLAALALITALAPVARADTIQVTTTADPYDLGNPGGRGVNVDAAKRAGGQCDHTARSDRAQANLLRFSHR
jgi:hypothetical protein